MSLLFNKLSRLVITFLPRSKCLLISWLQSPFAGIWEPKKIKSVTVSIVSPSKCHKSTSLILQYDIRPLLTKVRIVKAMVFPVVMYGCESWTVKKAEYQRTDVFELWCWRRLLRVPWTARRSAQSILKESSPEYSLKGLMLKLKLQYFGHLMQRTDSLEKTLMLEKIEGRRRRG